MSENKIGFALVHEICPICGKPMNEQILMNSVLSKKYAKEIENVHGKAIGYSKTACEDCSKYKDEAVMCIAIDEAKSEPNNPYRTGQIVGVCKDFQLFVDKPEFIIKTENGFNTCYIKECQIKSGYYIPFNTIKLKGVKVEIKEFISIMTIDCENSDLIRLSNLYDIDWKTTNDFKNKHINDITVKSYNNYIKNNKQ